MTTPRTGGQATREVAEPYRLMTAEEFFEWSDGTDTRYELVSGMLYAQAATSRNHARLASRLIATLVNASAATQCDVVSSGGGILISDSTVYLPDAAVVCDPTDNDSRYVVRPCIVAEILSPTTESTDRREKLAASQRIDSLLTYLVIYQDARRIERHWREDAASPWQLMIYTGGSIPLPCLNSDLAIDDMYRNVAVGNLDEQTS